MDFSNYPFPVKFQI